MVCTAQGSLVVLVALARVPPVAYGILDLLAPGTAIRWQVRATARRKGMGREAGSAFAHWMKIDRSREPWNDPAVRHRVRLLGAGLIVASACILGVLALVAPSG
jgi:hypothetical protein